MATASLAPFPTAAAAYKSATFWAQLVLTMAINFGINFGIEWASMSEWGKKSDPSAWPGIAAVRLDTAVNSCLALDMLLTTFSCGFLCTLLATGGTEKEVREKKCAMLEPAAIAGGLWRWTPVPIENLCARSLATGVYMTVLIGAPSFLFAWAGIGNGYMNGYSYVVFKGVWGMFVSALVYALVFPAAISKRNFPDLEFEELIALANKLPDDDEDAPSDATPLTTRTPRAAYL